VYATNDVMDGATDVNEDGVTDDEEGEDGGDLL